LILFQQVNFLADKELGFNKEKLLHFPMKKSLFNNFETSRAAFQEVPGVTSVSTCFGIPGDIVSGDNIILPEKGRKELPARIFAIDYDYIETMGMEIIAGRDFSEEFGNDANENFIINETALKKLGIADSPAAAIGKPLEWNEWSKEKKVKKGKIIGVVKDFHYTSLHEAVQASILHIYPDAYWKMAIRINTENVSQTIAGIEQVWDQFNTGYPIDYQFVDEGFGKMYKAEEKLSQLLWIFTLLAIFISCIGAFGLAAYTAERRRKEIGIRKVLGASTNGIITLLTKDFLKLVVLALFFAAPLAWYLMSSWLENFAYRIEIQVWVFLIAGLLTLLIAFLTVGFNSLRAALANPVQSLKAE
jgi:putative ABC transport system permease protein